MAKDGLALSRFVLVLSSLSPLFLLWALRGTKGTICDEIWVPLCILLFITPNAFLFIMISVARKHRNAKTIEVGTSKNNSEQLLTYLFAMMIPLFGVDFGELRDLLSLFLAVLFVTFVFWHMQLHYMNLLFALLGYRIFTVETPSQANNDSQSSQTYAVITKRQRIEAGKPFTGLRLGGNVLLDDAGNDRARNQHK
jgi:hypothetical protein